MGQRTLHRDRLAIQVRRHVSGIRQAGLAIRRDAQRQAGSMRLALAHQPPVQRFQDDQWITAPLRGASYRTDQQRDQHARLQPLARHVAGYDQQAAIAGDDRKRCVLRHAFPSFARRSAGAGVGRDC
jgi:hypothetical protein